jgi:hypothetical protein
MRKARVRFADTGALSASDEVAGMKAAQMSSTTAKARRSTSSPDLSAD